MGQVGWKQGFMQATGPGLILGVTMGDLIRLLAENRFQVEPRYWPRALFAAAVSLITTSFGAVEKIAYTGRVAKQAVLPPIFIIGHWRSGTTHLHNLLAVDKRFAYARFAQVMIPNSFLLGEPVLAACSGMLLPPNRMGVDEVAMHPGVPWEEEFGLCAATFLSPYMGWAFPARAAHYDRYLTFRGVPECEVQRWKAAFVTLLKKLTLRYQRPLVLKSPPNTGRIRLLLEMFPDARFVHIHRDPYVVYQSTRHLHLKSWEVNSLQRPDLSEVHDRIMWQYSTLFDAFFEEKSLIPAGRYSEVAFRDLDGDPVGSIRRIYEELSLPDFKEVEVPLNEYVRSLRDYKKNQHPELSPEVRAEIAQKWRRSFETWNYPTGNTGDAPTA